MLARSCRYLADVLACPKRVVDLKVLAANVRSVALELGLKDGSPGGVQ